MVILCQDLVQVIIRNFSHFNLPKVRIDKSVYCPDIGDIRTLDSVRTVRIKLFIKDIT